MKLSDLSSIKVHIIGINGIGMSALAIYLKKNNVDITGSDITYNANTINLEKHKIPVFVNMVCNKWGGQPFEDPKNRTDAEKLILSAPNLFSAREKLIFVLVEFSKNIFTTVFPFNRIAFLSSVCRISLNLKDVSIILFKSDIGKFSRPIRCLLLSIYSPIVCEN